MNLRKVMYIVIAIVCVWSIFIGVYEQVNSKPNKDNNIAQNEIVPFGKQNTNQLPTQEELKKEFDRIFTNQIMLGQYNTEIIKKINNKEPIIYDFSFQRKTDIFEIDIHFPMINIQGDVASAINDECKSAFIGKANEINQNATEQTIYTISYTAYVNNDILSIIVKSSLKEGNNAQKTSVHTYNYNLVTNKRATLDDLLSIRQIEKDDVSEKIKQTINEAIKEASSIQQTGYEVYTRNTNDSMYNVENVSVFFLDKNGALCIIFPYGNYDEYTSEMDIVKI